MTSKRILAFSSSRYGNRGYLKAAAPVIKKFLDSKTTNIAFIPFASVEKNYDEYATNVNNALGQVGIQINAAKPRNARSLVETCDAIIIGGGNTFKLLHDIYELNLVNLIKEKVNNGTPYIGWSAGSNILSPTIGTTNDMPVIQPKSFNALGIFSFQINPHYFNQKVESFNGETRDQRLEEFIEVNPQYSILALPEGTWLELQNNNLMFCGEAPGTLFQRGELEESIIKTPISNTTDLSFLIKS